MDKEKILAFAKKQGYDGIEPLGKWKNYDCYEPIINNTSENNPSFVGPPLIILVQGEKVRMSTVDESFQQMDDMDEIDEI